MIEVERRSRRGTPVLSIAIVGTSEMDREQTDAAIRALQTARREAWPRCPYGHELTGKDACSGGSDWCGER